MPSKPILIMAGGTGGHVYPALAIAEYLSQKGIPLMWLGTEKGLEARVVPAKGFTLFTIPITGLRGKGLFKWIQAPVIISIALVKAILILARLKPAVVLGMGGFVSGPGGIAAWLMRIPLCIHEQNAVAGLTNRLLAPFARCVMAAFPDTFPENINAKVTGNPVRPEIFRVENPDSRIKTDSGLAMRVLVLGGSRGARKLNQIIPEVLTSLAPEIKLEIWHQSGSDHYSETDSEYSKLNYKVKLQPYIENMAEAYAWADIVICRAGALTVAELSAAGAASILIPFPYAVDDHQTANARFLTESGAAILIQERDLNSDVLCKLLSELFLARHKLLVMAQHARTLALPEATRNVAETCLEVAYA